MDRNITVDTLTSRPFPYTQTPVILEPHLNLKNANWGSWHMRQTALQTTAQVLTGVMVGLLPLAGFWVGRTSEERWKYTTGTIIAGVAAAMIIVYAAINGTTAPSVMAYVVFVTLAVSWAVIILSMRNDGDEDGDSGGT